MRSPFAIGSKVWPGLGMLVKTAGALSLEAGKLMSTGGLTYHWDGSNVKERIEEELGNMLAAIGFFLFANPSLNIEEIERRRLNMLDTFKRWQTESSQIKLLSERDIDRAMQAFGPLDRSRSESDFRTDMQAAIESVLSVPGSVKNLE